MSLVTVASDEVFDPQGPLVIVGGRLNILHTRTRSKHVCWAELFNKWSYRGAHFRFWHKADKKQTTRHVGF